MSLTLTNIPKIMRAQGWHKGAALLSRWFRGPATIVPNYVLPDTATITMDWVLGWAKPKAVYDSIFSEQVWANEPGRKLLAKRLSQWGKLTPFQTTFDQTVKAVPLLENEYVNRKPYGGGYSGYSGYSGSSAYSSSDASLQGSDQYSGVASTGLNDLIAALGAFNFRVVVAGSVVPMISGGYQVTITKVGVFVRDSFDFEGFQFLGFWNDSTNTVSIKNPLAGSAVFNSTFRDYRDQNGKGGDFLVFSNLKVTTLSPPHTFKL